MNIAFRYEGKVAQIILMPTEAADESQLQMIRNFGDKNVRLKLASEKGMIVEFDANGKEAKSAAPVEKAPA